MKEGDTHRLNVGAQPQKELEGRMVLHVPFCSWTTFPNTMPPTCPPAPPSLQNKINKMEFFFKKKKKNVKKKFKNVKDIRGGWEKWGEIVGKMEGCPGGWVSVGKIWRKMLNIFFGRGRPFRVRILLYGIFSERQQKWT